MPNYEKAMLDPTAVFKHPRDLLSDTSFSDEQKIKILEQWAYDAKELEVANDENMTSEKRSLLHAVLECLQTIKDQ